MVFCTYVDYEWLGPIQIGGLYLLEFNSASERAATANNTCSSNDVVREIL